VLWSVSGSGSESTTSCGRFRPAANEARKARETMRIGNEANIVLRVSNLCKYFPVTKGVTRRRVGTVRAVDRVSFFVRDGEVFGLVGESGCGKTTTGRTILRALEPTSGIAFFDLNDGSRPFALFDLEREQLKAMRRHMRMIFQDPYSSLNPRMNVRELIAEPLRIHGVARTRSDIDDRVATILQAVGLEPGVMTRYPHAFSGGQRQRIGIARALVLNPKFIIADEAVSALDVSVQAQILNLMQDLKEEFGLTYLFIAHNLAVVEHICDRIGVMYVGRMMELADTEELYHRPLHPYTEALLGAVPRSEPGPTVEHQALQGEVADAANPPSGCSFHPRCIYATDFCRQEEPLLENVAPEDAPPHFVACHFAERLSLRGI